MLKKLCILEKLIIIVLLLSLTSCATTQKQPIVKIETIEKPEITNNLDNSLSDLTTQITNSINEDGKKKIAVIEFSDLEGNVTQFGKYLAEELITRLFRTKKFEVVERQLLNKIISEQKLSITGMIDPNSAKELGRILGVDAIVSGTITDFVTDLKVNARIISTETGKVFGVAATNIVKDNNVRKLMGIISTVQKEEVREQTEKKEISKEVLKKVEVENFTFELTKCEMSEERITCDLLIINNTKDRELSISFQKSFEEVEETRIIDDSGNEYGVEHIQLGSRTEVGKVKTTASFGGGLSGPYKIVRNSLISGIPMRMLLTFDNVSPEVSGIAVLEIRCSVLDPEKRNWKAFKVQLRNIPLSRGIISTVQKEEVQKQMEKKEISKEVLKKVEAEKFTFEIIKCEMSSGGRVTCDLLVTNNDDKDRELMLYIASKLRIFDDFGNEYRPNQVELANKKRGGTNYSIQSLLISDISTKVSLTFKNVTQEASSISLLEIGCYEQESGNFAIKLHNIPLSK